MTLKVLIRRYDNGTDALHVAWSAEQVAVNAAGWQGFKDELARAVANGELAGWGEVDTDIVTQSLTAAVKRAAKQAT